MEIGAAFSDARVFGPWFKGASWDGWRAVLRAAFAERMTKAETAFFRTVANRAPPSRRVKEFWAIAGRRAGKDSVASGIAAHVAASFEARGRLRPGERALVACLAVDRAQAQTVLGYTRAFFETVPALTALVEHETSDGFELSNGVDVAILTGDYRSIRGRTILTGILDEAAFWRDEHSSNPDREIFRGIRPGMGTLSESMLIGITSPHSRPGLAYERWSRHFGRDSKSVLVIQAESRMLNPTLDQAIVDEALAEDPEAARADYLGQWRDDLAQFIGREMIESCVDRGVKSRPYDKRQHYVAFVDTSSGRSDSFCAAIAHKQDGVAVLDCLIEIRAPFNTATATATIAATLRAYHMREVAGDGFAAGWVQAEFSRHGIVFKAARTVATAGLASKLIDRSSLYLECLPLLASGQARLLDNERMIGQFCALERRAMPGGRDRVDHPNRTGHHDDASNAVAGALWRATTGAPPMGICEMFAADPSLAVNSEQAIGLRRPNRPLGFCG